MIDIIIVNYNSTEYLSRCLDSVIRSLKDIPAKIFVQDNGSRDGIDMIRNQFPGVLLEQSNYNRGFAAAVNRALTLGNNPFVVLLNPDTIVSETFFKESLRFMKSNPSVGIMGPKVLEKDGRIQHSARSFPTFLTAFFGRTSVLTKLFPRNPISLKNLKSLSSDGFTPMEVDWVSGACMVINRKAIDFVGGLDERFFLYWEDADWCLRMWQSHWKVVYYPNISICHYTGISSEKEILRSVFEFHKSAYRFFDKQKHPLFPGFLKLFVLAGLLLRSSAVIGSHLILKR